MTRRVITDIFTNTIKQSMNERERALTALLIFFEFRPTYVHIVFYTARAPLTYTYGRNGERIKVH